MITEKIGERCVGMQEREKAPLGKGAFSANGQACSPAGVI